MKIENSGGKHATGFTLLELLLVLTLFILILSFAVPNLQTFYFRHKANVQTQQMIRALHLARNLALIKHTSVLICPITTEKVIACGQRWQQGLAIFSITEGERTLINTVSAFTDANITWNRSKNEIIFAANRTLASQNGSFHYQLSNEKRTIILSRTGRVTLQ